MPASPLSPQLIWTPRALPAGRIRLEQLRHHHAEHLFDALNDSSVWAYIPHARPAHAEDMRAYIDSALAAQDAGNQIAIVMIDQATCKPIGTSRFTDISPAHRQLEIGWTMLSPRVQRTSANTEAKALMLTFAFEQLDFGSTRGCIRVQLKCDHRNLPSQAAILRIGGVFEGRLRQHRILPDGFIRDTMFYSILASEWPGAKARLIARLDAHRA